MNNTKTGKILIVDDSAINRLILTEILGEEYTIIEADNGLAAIEALQEHGTDISLVLLDIVMPEMDGFEVLAVMNKYRFIEQIPVIMISSESGSGHIKRAYDLGVSDYINRPFDTEVVQKRVENTMMLYAKQKRLIEMVTDQMYEKQKSNKLMVNILSHIVEFRNGESGLHVLHVHMITAMLLRLVSQKTDKYKLAESDIELISMASALHDIGKIAIPDEILNKPGKLTQEEFEIMKTHAAIGAGMLEDIPFGREEDLVKTAYEICRWHHERYDGRGYPDGLKGEEIPISAQAVSLADVYDALTSERVYKKAFSHEKALEMIFNGECGTFNPLLLECLKENGDLLREELRIESNSDGDKREIVRMTEEILNREVDESNPTMMLLYEDRQKAQLLDSMLHTPDPRKLTKLQLWPIVRQFELVFDTVRLVDVKTSTQYVVDEDGQIVTKPYRCWSVWNKGEKCKNCSSERALEQKGKVTKFESIGDDLYHISSMYVEVDKEPYVLELVSKMSTSSFLGLEGEDELAAVIDIYNEKLYLDSVTGIYNRRYMDECIDDEFGASDSLSMLNIDDFKQYNEKYGNLFGDEILKAVAKTLAFCTRKSDSIIRYGGDEFIIVMRNISPSAYDKKIKNIEAAVTQIAFAEHPDISLKVRVGSAIGKGNLSERIEKATKALDKAKKK